MKKYAYQMAATVEDHDYPKRAAHKLGVSEDVALALESHVDQYADMMHSYEQRSFLFQKLLVERQVLLFYYPYLLSHRICLPALSMRC